MFGGFKGSFIDNYLMNKIEKLNTKLDNLSIGGTNLIKNSATLNGSVSMNGGASKFEVISDNSAMSGFHVKITITADTPSGISGGVYIRPINIINNTRYTYSFDVKLSKNIDVTVGFENKGGKRISATTEWSKVTHTFTSGNITSDAFDFYPVGGLVIGDILYIRDFKVEYGDKATNWSPHPADLVSKNEISNSMAVTATGRYALDAVQANTSLVGTLANQITTLNTNLTSIKEKLDGYAPTKIKYDTVLVNFSNGVARYQHNFGFLSRDHYVMTIMNTGNAALFFSCHHIDGNTVDVYIDYPNFNGEYWVRAMAVGV